MSRYLFGRVGFEAFRELLGWMMGVVVGFVRRRKAKGDLLGRFFKKAEGNEFTAVLSVLGVVIGVVRICVSGRLESLTWTYMWAFFVGFVIDRVRKIFEKEEGEKDRDFETNLLLLCVLVAKNGTGVSEVKKGYVVRRFVELFGREKTQEVIRNFNKSVKFETVNMVMLCRQIVGRTEKKAREEIVELLFGMCKAEGEVNALDVVRIVEVANYLLLTGGEFERIRAKFVEQKVVCSSDYEILGVEKGASEYEIKRKYRQLAMKYHPDRQVEASESEKKKAEEEFKKIKSAYERLMR